MYPNLQGTENDISCLCKCETDVRMRRAQHFFDRNGNPNYFSVEMVSLREHFYSCEYKEEEISPGARMGNRNLRQLVVNLSVRGGEFSPST